MLTQTREQETAARQHPSLTDLQIIRQRTRERIVRIAIDTIREIIAYLDNNELTTDRTLEGMLSGEDASADRLSSMLASTKQTQRTKPAYASRKMLGFDVTPSVLFHC